MSNEAEKFTPYIEETPVETTEKIRSSEEIRDELKKQFLIVDDGYDYSSPNPPEDLPTVFHGTSAWFEEDIKKFGLTNDLDSVDSIQEVFQAHPDLGKLLQSELRWSRQVALRMKPEKNEWRRKVYCTLNHENAENYTRGSEIIRDYIELVEDNYSRWHDKRTEPFEKFIDKIITELGSIDTREKKLLMSCFKPKPLIVHAKPTKKEFDPEETLKYGGSVSDIAFLTNRSAREELFEEIRWARERYLKHAKGDLVSPNEASRLWSHIQGAANIARTSQEFETLSLADLSQIYLRQSFKELLFNKIEPKSVIRLENINLTE